MTPEGKVKAKVKRLLTRHNAYYHMPVQRGYGAPALDFHVCSKGRYAGIETKAPGEVPTERQEIIIEDVITSGGVVFVIDDDKGIALLEEWLTGAVIYHGQVISKGINEADNP